MKILKLRLVVFLFSVMTFAGSAAAKEDFNNCRGATSETCERSGSCAIQGAAWYQTVTIDRSEKFDTQGWTGLCDMVHVALVQANCSPLYSQDEITAYLSSTSYAEIPSISGPLSCGGNGGEGVAMEICDDGIDNDNDGKIDCLDRRDCRSDSYCR